ncbi:MAG: DNA-binding protein [Halothiobacillus sp.]|nr:DNA-binding protein [Halothiobacillus sp.]
MSAAPLRTPEQARAALESKGVSIAKWATANGFSTGLVYEVLKGRKKCLRGQAHEIAVKLGIKAGAICTEPAGVLDDTSLSSANLLDQLRAVFPQEIGQAAGIVLLPLHESVQQAMERGGLLSLLEIPQIEILAGHPTPRVISLLALLGSQSVQFPLQTSIVKRETGF